MSAYAPGNMFSLAWRWARCGTDHYTRGTTSPSCNFAWQSLQKLTLKEIQARYRFIRLIRKGKPIPTEPITTLSKNWAIVKFKRLAYVQNVYHCSKNSTHFHFITLIVSGKSDVGIFSSEGPTAWQHWRYYERFMHVLCTSWRAHSSIYAAWSSFPFEPLLFR